MTEKDHYKYGLSGDKVDVEVAERLRAKIRDKDDRIRELEARIERVRTVANTSGVRSEDMFDAVYSLLADAPQAEGAVNPTRQHQEFCGALRGMPCICNATPLETKGDENG